MSHGVAKKGHRARCPACGAEIHFRKPPRRGNFITCQECDSMLEVRRPSPLTLEWASEQPLGRERRRASGSVGKSGGRRLANQTGQEDEPLEDDWP